MYSNKNDDLKLKKKRTRQLILTGCLFLLPGLLYLIFINVTGLAVPCPFHALTGLKCPGCGITTMILAISKGDLASAFKANSVLFVLSPAILYLIVKGIMVYIGSGSSAAEKTGLSRTDDMLCRLLIAIFIIWGILRNIL